MGIHRPKEEPPQFLSGWKEIANYLGKGVRTVQRYERELGLPVRRPTRRATGSVVATKVELDAWVNASPIRSAFLLRRHPDEFSLGAAAIRNNISEMSRLREQMRELRAELRASMEGLRAGLVGLQESLNVKRREGAVGRTALPASSTSGSYILELLGVEPARKAN